MTLKRRICKDHCEVVNIYVYLEDRDGKLAKEFDCAGKSRDFLDCCEDTVLNTCPAAQGNEQLCDRYSRTWKDVRRRCRNNANMKKHKPLCFFILAVLKNKILERHEDKKKKSAVNR